MANNYSNFSEMIENITPAEAEWIETVLALRSDEAEDLAKLEAELDVKDVDLDSWPSFEVEIRGELMDGEAVHRLWLYSEEAANYEHVEWFVSAFIHKFRPDFIFALTNAETCSKPRVGEFGGGWLVVSREGAWGGNTWDAASAKVAEIEKSRKKEECA